MAARVPAPQGQSATLAATVRMEASLHQELMGALVDLKRLHAYVGQLQQRIVDMEAAQTGVQPLPPQFPAYSPPRDDPAYGSAAARTRIG